MHLSATLHYDADVSRVGVMLADPEFVAAKLRASGALSQDAAVVGDPGQAFTVTTRRSMPTDQIPAQFRSFVGSTVEVRHVEAWEAPAGGERRGTVVIEILGAPVRYTGRLHLSGTDGGGATLVVDGDLKASVPLFAATVEEAASGAVRAAIAAEQDAGTAWLAAHPA